MDAWILTKMYLSVPFILQEKDKAFNLKCPHLGCAIDFRKQSNDYFCPRHNSSFALMAR